MKKLSVVIPCYNEEKSLPLFYDEINRVSKFVDLDFEFIFVNDGSVDDTLEVIKTFCNFDAHVKYLSFSRNFGKEAALYAGLCHAVHTANSDFLAIMDADLQDPPQLLCDMYTRLKNENLDCVAARRVSRTGEPPIRSFFARQFYKLINKISKTEVVDGARDFRIMTHQMADSVVSLGEYNRFSKGLFSWVGFDTAWIEYENIERAAGETKWSFWKLFMYSMDGIVAFSTVPLWLSSMFGMLFFILSIIGIITAVIRQAVWGISAYGWTSLVCLILLVTGIQLFCIGILGQYLSKLYLESKGRPIYIVKEKNV